MVDIVLSEAEKTWILNGIRDNVRCDGRECKDFRMLEIETNVVSNTNGSSRVRLANTDVLVGVKAELDTPLPERPAEGRIEFFVDCSANATPEFEGRGGADLALEVSSALSQAYNNSKCLDLKSLCILKEQQCWVLYVDVVVLECGGNLYDAASFAVKGALYDTKIPKINLITEENGQMEIELSDDPFDYERIDVSHTPCFVTIAQIGHHFVVDPSLEEEACSRSNIVMAVTKQGSFSCVRKIGSGSIHPESLFDILDTGIQIGQELNKKLMKKLKQEEELGTNKERRGFLN